MEAGHRIIWDEFSPAAVLEQAPWWLCSAVIHLTLILILAGVNFATMPKVERPPITIDPTAVVPERVPPPMERDVFDQEKEEAARNVAEEAAGELDKVAAEVPVPKVLPISFSDIAIPVIKWETTVFDAGRRKWVGLTEKVAPSDRSLPVIVDALAEEILREIEKRELLVVMLFDESKSLLEDRKIIAMKIHRTIHDLRREMTPREAMRLKWSVVSYGEKPSLVLQPTGSLAELLEAAETGIRTDETGTENLVQALEFVMKTFAPLRKQMFIVAVTDEEGNDVTKRDRLMAVLQSMMKHRTRLFVFGREASFQSPTVPEWLRDRNGERKGPWGRVDRGLESADQECFRHEWFLIPNWGRVPAGYGCYIQSMLALQTGGTYFILSEVPSAYDEEKLDLYKPEWDIPQVYEQRMKTSRLRTTLNTLFKQFHRLTPENGSWPWLNELDRLKAQTNYKLGQGKKAIQLVNDAASKLGALAGKRNNEKYAKQRWTANYDLTMAELLRLKFVLREYEWVLRDCLKRGYPKPHRGRKFNLFTMQYNTRAAEARTGRRGERDWHRAKEALKSVIERHEGTPHAEAAKYQLGQTAPAILVPAFHVEPKRPIP